MKNILIALLLLVGSVSATTRYIATNGNDSNAGTSGSRFLTWNKCYQVSALGDTCIIGSGTYVANQDFVTNAAIAGGTFHQTPTGTGEVTFQSETGNNADVVLIGDLHFGSSFTTSPPDHITIKNITLGDGTIGADGYTANGWMQIRAAKDIHFVGVHFRYVQQWNCADYVSDQFAEHGPSTYPDLMDLYGDAYNSCNITPGHWLIEDSSLHGMTTNNAGDHPDGIAPDGARDLIVRRNVFYNNCSINYRGGPITANQTVENNYFGPPVNCAVGTLFNVSITGPATIRFNTIDGTIQPPNSPWNNNQLYDSNIINGQINGGNCPNGTATVAQYNVWLNSNPTGACGGAANTRVANMTGWFVGTPTNYDLTATASAALGAANPSSFPATDIHSTTRVAPITAGAFQRVSGGPTNSINPTVTLTESDSVSQSKVSHSSASIVTTLTTSSSVTVLTVHVAAPTITLTVADAVVRGSGRSITPTEALVESDSLITGAQHLQAQSVTCLTHFCGHN